MVQNTSVGLDVHARTVVGCAIINGTGEVVERRFGPASAEVVGWVAGLPGPVTVAYEAGPTGFGLARDFAEAGVECLVAAPSKLLPKPGDRVKTDRRDARHLAGLVHAGLVTPVRVPTVEEESVRDVLRAREDASRALMTARHQASKLALRHGHVYPGKTTWNKTHMTWLSGLDMGHPAARTALGHAIASVADTTLRRDSLDQVIEQMAAESVSAPVITALGCLRGVSLLTGFGLAVEIGDWSRFTGATIAAFAGLVPSEHSSGRTRSQGGVTKTGNTHVRHLLVESAWHHRPAYDPARSQHLQARWAQAPAQIRQRGHEANRRLHAQWTGFERRGKKPTTANAAVARQLAGFCWSLAMMTG